MTMIAGNNGASGKVVLGICILLALITWLVFGQTLGHEFINYDDPGYVSANPEVMRGITPHQIVWAFTHSHSYNWHPLTTISHMLDCQLYGLKAGAHHFTNVALHIIAVLLLFLVLRAMTGRLWRSAFVSALFAIHPLHVESVAWIAERKDVLSGVFFMLTLAAYRRYARRPSFASYLLVALAFALGLLSKAMLVTVPFVLLLLDYWPLGRFTEATSAARDRTSLPWFDRLPTVGKLILEKLPLLVLSVASCVMTFMVQREAMSSIAVVPIWVRVYNAALSCVTYIYQMFWPARLAVFYPYPVGRLSLWPFLFAIGFLVALTIIGFRLRKERPYLIIGWLWYLGMLVPVIGIIQVGDQARADRYTYLPQIGLYFLLTWAASDFLAGWRHRRKILSVVAITAIAVLSWRAWIQTSYWKDSESIWTRTLAVTSSSNAFAHENVGFLLMEKGQTDAGISHLEETLKLWRDFRMKPKYAEGMLIHYFLGTGFLDKGMVDKAIFHYRKALQLNPDYADAELQLGRALFRKGQVDEAIACWQQLLSTHRDEAEAHTNLGDAFLGKGLTGDAIAHYAKALEIAPRSTAALNRLAWVLSTCSDAQLRNGSRAIPLAEQADQLAGGKTPEFIRTLAAAYAEGGRFNDAIDAAQRALPLAVAKGDAVLAGQLQLDIDLYRINIPRR